ncbi:MAG TPA: hypothetical protein PK900_13050, partial [Spirochaetota bacterium]|nr:hypothetical protein [Spirochaetota bacterium]
MRFIEPLLSLIFSNPKRKLVLTVIVSMLLQTTIFAQGNNGGLNTTSFNCRLPDVNRTNKAYSVVDDNGFYDCSCDNVVFEISGNIQSKCAQIEKDKGLLDETEFYVATYYSPIKIENVEAAKVIKEEFPDGPEGVFRRCALLFKGVAENSTDAAGYDTALSELLTAAGLTYEDAKAYYDRAITV